jgi:hypothetical protein
MTLTPMQAGLAIGGSIGLAGLFVLRYFARWMELKRPNDEGRAAADFLRKAAWADLIIMLMLGAYIGQSFGS